MAWTPSHIAAAPGLNAAGGQYRHVSVTPLGGALGATIGQVDLSQELDDETVAEIRRALLDHLVIFFRDQDITPAQHKAFGAHFGTFYRHEFVAGMSDEHPEIIVVAKTPEDQFNFGGDWHSDITYAKQPPLGLISDNQTRKYDKGDSDWKKKWELFAWGSNTKKFLDQ